MVEVILVLGLILLHFVLLYSVWQLGILLFLRPEYAQSIKKAEPEKPTTTEENHVQQLLDKPG